MRVYYLVVFFDVLRKALQDTTGRGPRMDGMESEEESWGQVL